MTESGLGEIGELNFSAVFYKACEQTPYPYQCRLACGENALLDRPQTLTRGSECRSSLINIPTGLGKTAAVTLAWLWNRVLIPDTAHRNTWPRRLVYCLPMRALVEQTHDVMSQWLKCLALSHQIAVSVLMGGEGADDWDLYPEKDAIIIGTQDMLLSRALNRGYGMSRYRWPIQFGLLNNDCLWVLDEIQLMGPGLATACQLEAFRLQNGSTSISRFNSYPEGRSVTWYASATADQRHLQTQGWRGLERLQNFLLELSENEKSARTGKVAERRLATKRLEVRKDRNFGGRKDASSPDLMDEIIAQHKNMTLNLNGAPEELPRRTLVICNTVDRAMAVYSGIRGRLSKGEEIDILLMHSRFRSAERRQQADRLQNSETGPGGQLIVSSQVIEAGIDLSSAILWTEIAPLACLVQRFGRLNRKGEFGYEGHTPYRFTAAAIVIGIDVPDSESRTAGRKDQRDRADEEAQKRYLPYDKAKCDEAWTSLDRLHGDASPRTCAEINEAIIESIDRCPYSLQSHELLDFFDTDANLSLGFTDVSPFVRDIDSDTDFYVAWREWPGSDDGKAPGFSADFQSSELCPVAIRKKSEAHTVLSNGWLWLGKDAGWSSVRRLDIAPGMAIMLPTMAGGYRTDVGWTGSAEDKPVVSIFKPVEALSDPEMLSSLDHGWRSIEQHTLEVSSELLPIIEALGGADLAPEEQHAVLRGVHWHDTGKNHDAWRCAVERALAEAGISVPRAFLPIAKFSLADSPRLKEGNDNGTPKFSGDALKKELWALRRSFRPGIAHEVASALAFRRSEQAAYVTHRPIQSLLAEYLVMSHHGRVRKVLRDEIPKQPRSPKDTEAVRGVSNGDELPHVAIAGQTLGCASLSTDCRRMGRDADGHESYTKGVLRLLDHYGPFRLAFYEALFRAADIRASKRAREEKPSNPCL